MTRNVGFSLLLSILMSCSNSKPISFPVNSMAVRLFGERVIQRFTNYSEASGYKEFIEISTPWLRGPDKGIRVIWYHARPPKEVAVIYTFDRIDSCILYSGPIEDDMYELVPASLPLPRGRYLLKLGDSIGDLYCP